MWQLRKKFWQKSWNIFVPVIIDCSCGCIVLYKAVALAIVFVLMEFYQNISLLKIFQTFEQNFNVTQMLSSLRVRMLLIVLLLYYNLCIISTGKCSAVWWWWLDSIVGVVVRIFVCKWVIITPACYWCPWESPAGGFFPVSICQNVDNKSCWWWDPSTNIISGISLQLRLQLKSETRLRKEKGERGEGIWFSLNDPRKPGISGQGGMDVSFSRNSN